MTTAAPLASAHEAMAPTLEQSNDTAGSAEALTGAADEEADREEAQPFRRRAWRYSQLDLAYQSTP